MTQCPNCGAPIADAASPFCGACGAPISPTALPETHRPTPPPQASSEPLRMPFPPPPASRATAGVPWEDPSRGTWLDRLVDTTKRILTTPTAFFRSMPTTGGVALPLAYAVILGSLGTWVSLVYDAVSREAVTAWVPVLRQQYGWLLGAAGLTSSLITAVLAPFFVVLGAFVVSGLVHLCLMLVGGARKGFEATFRAYAYSSGASSILMLIPFCGGLVGTVAWIWLAIVGLTEAHETSMGRAAAAVLLPLVVVCCLCAGVGVAIALLVPSIIGNWAP